MATSSSPERAVVLSLGELERDPTVDDRSTTSTIMATSSSPERAVVLSLGELERDHDRYEMTLPFYNKNGWPHYRPLDCSCAERKYSWAPCVYDGTCPSFAKVKAMAVRQTEKRWGWFSEARKLDDRLGRRLGTLGYLPLEIREKIWHAAIEGCAATDFSGCYLNTSREPTIIKSWDIVPLHMIQSSRSHQIPLNMTQSSRSHPTMGTPHIEFCPDNMFDFPINAFKKPCWNSGVMQLRHASPDLKIELDNVIVSASTFSFSCPLILRQFLNSSSAQQINSLRSITIELSSCSSSCDYDPVHVKSCFEAWIATIEHLPATLQSFKLELDFVVLGLLTKTMSYPLINTDEVMAQFEIIVKKIRRQAPNAKFSTSCPWRPKPSGIVRRMFDELTSTARVTKDGGESPAKKP